MTYRETGSCLRGGLRIAARVAAVAFLCAGAACGSPQATSDAGSCGANVPAGQACNTLANVGAAVTPTCDPGTIPAGTGGTIVDGTYTLTSQTYYGTTACPSTPVEATLEIAGSCVQEVSGSPIAATASTTHTVAGANITRIVTCLDVPGVDAASFSYDTETNTFTATPTTFTIFIKNSGTTSANPDRVEVYQKH